MNVRLLSIIGLMSIMVASPANAQRAAGLPCANSSPENIQFGVGSDAMDDLLACVSGTWHSMIYGGSPSGTIQAFNLTSCPGGWAPAPALAGRAIIGAGSGPGLTPRIVGSFGGEEAHQQSIAELPQFQVSFTFGASDKGGRGNGFAYSDDAGGSTVRAIYYKTSNTIGNGTPFNVMMPYYTLLYCMKQ